MQTIKTTTLVVRTLRTRNVANSTKCNHIFTACIPFNIIFPIAYIQYTYGTLNFILEGSVRLHLKQDLRKLTK